MNFKEIKELVKLLEHTEISEFSWETEGTKVTIKKGGTQIQTIAAPVNPVYYPQNMGAVAPQLPQSTAVEAGGMKEKTETLGPNMVTVFAPMVGTFYRSPSPDAEPYVQANQNVEVGQVLCIIEAMKLMNEIESEIRGKIVKILVENGQPVEYGQPLYIIEKI